MVQKKTRFIKDYREILSEIDNSLSKITETVNKFTLQIILLFQITTNLIYIYIFLND